MMAVVALATFGYFGLSSHSSAETGITESEVVSSFSRQVSELKVYGLNATIPRSISYRDSQGWSGTLYLESKQPTGDHYLVVYSGTVYCSGACAMSEKEAE